jgi:hypothetical protein
VVLVKVCSGRCKRFPKDFHYLVRYRLRDSYCKESTGRAKVVHGFCKQRLSKSGNWDTTYGLGAYLVLAQFEAMLIRIGFSLSHIVDSCYRPGAKEFIFNGHIFPDTKHHYSAMARRNASLSPAVISL